jgi:hypothetical protein
MIRNGLHAIQEDYSILGSARFAPYGPGAGLRTRSAWMAGFAALALALAGCGGEAESREDVEGEAVAEEMGGEVGESPRATAAEPVRALPAGTSLTFEVLEEVSTSSHRAGDTFALRLVQPVEGSGGLRLESGTRAQGIVTNVQRSGSPDEEAVLGVRIESVQVNGRSRALNGSVTRADVEAGAGDSRTRSAAKVATGAAAGAVIGQILGRDTRSTVTGAAAGAVAGLGVALTTRGGDAVLPEGARVTVRLDDTLAVE